MGSVSAPKSACADVAASRPCGRVTASKVAGLLGASASKKQSTVRSLEKMVKPKYLDKFHRAVHSRAARLSRAP